MDTNGAPRMSAVVEDASQGPLEVLSNQQKVTEFQENSESELTRAGTALESGTCNNLGECAAYAADTMPCGPMSLLELTHNLANCSHEGFRLISQLAGLTQVGQRALQGVASKTRTLGLRVQNLRQDLNELRDMALQHTQAFQAELLKVKEAVDGTILHERTQHAAQVQQFEAEKAEQTLKLQEAQEQAEKLRGTIERVTSMAMNDIARLRADRATLATSLRSAVKQSAEMFMVLGTELARMAQDNTDLIAVSAELRAALNRTDAELAASRELNRAHIIERGKLLASNAELTEKSETAMEQVNKLRQARDSLQQELEQKLAQEIQLVESNKSLRVRITTLEATNNELRKSLKRLNMNAIRELSSLTQLHQQQSSGSAGGENTTNVISTPSINEIGQPLFDSPSPSGALIWNPSTTATTNSSATATPAALFARIGTDSSADMFPGVTSESRRENQGNPTLQSAGVLTPGDSIESTHAANLATPGIRTADEPARLCSTGCAATGVPKQARQSALLTSIFNRPAPQLQSGLASSLFNLDRERAVERFTENSLGTDAAPLTRPFSITYPNAREESPTPFTSGFADENNTNSTNVERTKSPWRSLLVRPRSAWLQKSGDGETANGKARTSSTQLRGGQGTEPLENLRKRTRLIASID